MEINIVFVSIVSLLAKVILWSFPGYISFAPEYINLTPAETAWSIFVFANSIPLILYLSGLTCTDENVCQKGYPFPHCFANGLAFLAPDTSPRGAGIEGEDDTWQFGTGAGFYCDATEAPYSSNYNMYSYVVDELLSFVFAEWKVLNESKIIARLSDEHFLWLN